MREEPIKIRSCNTTVFDINQQRIEKINHHLFRFEDGKNYILKNILPGLNVSEYCNFDEIHLISNVNNNSINSHNLQIDKNNLFIHPLGFYFYITKMIMVTEADNQRSATFSFDDSNLPDTLISFVIGFSDSNWFVIPYSDCRRYIPHSKNKMFLSIYAEDLPKYSRTFDRILQEMPEVQELTCLFLDLLKQSII